MVDGDGRVSGRQLGQALYSILSNLAVLGFWTAVFVLARALGEIFVDSAPSLCGAADALDRLSTAGIGWREDGALVFEDI